jgi:hypothetical protein
MCLVGHWISEAIILRWAELVRVFSARSIPVSLVLEELLKAPETARDVNIAKSIYSSLSSLNCVWSNKILTGNRFDVDHIIPFSLWHNNDLWNLVPADQKINNAKRDRIISRELLRSSEERLVHYWRIQNEANPDRFQTEVSRTLFGRKMPKANWEYPTLAALSETMEMVALQRGVERWECH